ncbi:cytochrome C oxidase subunit IV family protein [Singulisphaera rosea]
MTEHTTAHVLPKSTYYAVYAALMVLLLVTVGAAYVDMGMFNFTVSLGIAVIKAVMIGLIFMHVRYSERLIWVFAGASFLWLAIMIVFTFNDYFTRGLLNIPGK